MNSSDTIHIDINDVSLRDGEQAPGNTMNLQEKLDCARQLHRLGVNGIEAGFAIASRGDLEAIQAVSSEVGNLPLGHSSNEDERFIRISSLARLEEADINAAITSVGSAARRGIHVFISTSPAMRVKFVRQITAEGGDPESDRDMVDRVIIPSIERSMQQIRQEGNGIITQFSPEDWTRTPDSISDDVILAAVGNGATIVNLPDTVGIGTPDVVVKRVARVRKLLDKNGYQHVKISWHGHNDTGMGVSNAIAALHGGATQFEPTILGIGERTGNFSFEGFLAALDANAEHHSECIVSMRRHPLWRWLQEWIGSKGKRMEITDTIVRKETMNTAVLFAAILGLKIPREHPIVGENAFAHESGIHQDGMLKDNMYEVLDPENYGAKSRLILGKHSGWRAIKEFLDTESLPYDISNKDMFRGAIKSAGEEHGRRKGMSDAEIKQWALYPLYQEMAGGDYIECIEDKDSSGAVHAVSLRDRDGNEIAGTASSAGKGRINAIVNAMQKIIPGVDIPEDGFEVHSIHSDQPGSATIARVTVTLSNQYSVTVQADDADTNEAIEKALLKAFNALHAIEKYAQEHEIEQQKATA